MENNKNQEVNSKNLNEAIGSYDIEIENKKQEMRTFSRKILKELYDGTYLKKQNNYFYDDFESKIQELTTGNPEGNGYYSKEGALLTEVLAEELISFVNNMVVDVDASLENKKAFFHELHKNFFGKSPDVFSQMNPLFFEKVKTLSKLNATYGLDQIVDTAGEISYDLAFSNDIVQVLEDGILHEDVYTSVLMMRQLGYAGRRSIGNGSWAEPAYKALKGLLLNIKEKYPNRLMKFLAEVEINKIDNYASMFFDSGTQETIPVREIINTVVANNSSISKEISLVQDIGKCFLYKTSHDSVSVLDARAEFVVGLLDCREKNINNQQLIKPYSVLDSTIIDNSKQNKSDVVKVAHNPEMLWFLNETFNVSLEDMYLREQVEFLDFISSSTEEVFSRVESISQKNSFNMQKFLRSFLSLSYNSESFSNKILEIGEKIPPEISNEIFEKYASIIDSVNEISRIASTEFSGGVELQPEDINKLEQSLYARGAKLLSDFHTKISENPDTSEILTELDRINTDTIATLSIFKYLSRNGQAINLEEISGAEFSEQTVDKFTDAEKIEMHEIYERNWRHFEHRELIERVINKFTQDLESNTPQQHKVYTFKKSGQINAFVKFSQMSPGVQYASALNVDSQSQGFGLGEAMMDQALFTEAQKSILFATCDSTNESNMRYLEKGFIATATSDDHPAILNICWNDSENMHIMSKQMHVDELAMMYLQNKVPENIIIKKSATLSELHTEFPPGMCLTRCFRNPVGGDWYAVYETVPDSYQTSQNT